MAELGGGKPLAAPAPAWVQADTSIPAHWQAAAGVLFNLQAPQLEGSTVQPGVPNQYGGPLPPGYVPPPPSSNQPPPPSY